MPMQKYVIGLIILTMVLVAGACTTEKNSSTIQYTNIRADELHEIMQGYTKVYNLEEGIVAWPYEKTKTNNSDIIP